MEEEVDKTMKFKTVDLMMKIMLTTGMVLIFTIMSFLIAGLIFYTDAPLAGQIFLTILYLGVTLGIIMPFMLMLWWE